MQISMNGAATDGATQFAFSAAARVAAVAATAGAQGLVLVLAWIGDAATAPFRVMKRRQAARRNAWLARNMPAHLRRDIGLEPDMAPAPKRRR